MKREKNGRVEVYQENKYSAIIGRYDKDSQFSLGGCTSLRDFSQAGLAEYINFLIEVEDTLSALNKQNKAGK